MRVANPKRGGNRDEAVEFGDAIVVEGVESPIEGVIVKIAGINGRGNEARDWLVLEKMGPRYSCWFTKLSPLRTMA